MTHTIQTRYAIGDVVFLAQVVYDKRQKTCPDCLGTCVWKAVLPCGDEIAIECPTCHRGYQCYGTIAVDNFAGYVKPLTIGSVRFDSNDAKCPVEYMAEETGVGSGSVYDETALFPTEAEATAMLPGMIAARQLEWDESTARNQKVRGKDAGRMAAYYRAQIREGERLVAKGLQGLEREKAKR